MTIIYQQIQTSADHNNAGCSGATAGVTVSNCLVTEGGTPGTTEKSVTLGAAQTGRYLFQMESASGEPGLTSWADGDWNVELNITTGSANVILQEVHCCRVNSSGTSQESLGSMLAIGFDTSTTGVWNTNVTCSAATAADTDRIYVVWVFDNTQMHANRTIGITPDAQITTPFTFPAVNVDLDGGTANLSTTRATLSQLVPEVFNELTSRTTGSASSQATLDLVDNNVYLTGRTLCHGLTWTSPADFVNREASTRTLNVSTSRATLSQQVDVTGRTTSVSTSRATLSQQLNATGRTTSITTSTATLSQEAGAVFNELTGRTLAGRAGYYTDVNTFVNVDLSGRTLCHGLTYTVAGLESKDLTGRTASLSTSRATISQLYQLDGRTTSVSTSRATLQSETLATDLNLTGRTLCHGLTYTVAGLETKQLTGRTTSVATTRATLAQVVPGAVTNDLTGRTLCHGLTYTADTAPVEIDVDLTGRTLCHGLTYSVAGLETRQLTGRAASIPTSRAALSQSGAGVDQDLTGRTLCHGLTYSFTPALEGAVNLSGRTACFAYPGGTRVVSVNLTGRTLCSGISTATLNPNPAAATADLTGRTLAGVAGYHTAVTALDLSGRTACFSYPGGTVVGAVNVNLTARTLCVSTSVIPSGLAVAGTIDLTARVMGVAGYWTQGPITVSINGRTFGLSSSRAELSQFQLIDIYGRTTSLTSSRAVLEQLTTTDLTGRILCIGSGRGVQDFIPRDVDIFGRVLCLSLQNMGGFTFTFPKIPGGELRGIILRVDPIGETARPINPRGRMAGVMAIGEESEGERRGVTAGLLSVGETK